MTATPEPAPPHPHPPLTALPAGPPQAVPQLAFVLVGGVPADRVSRSRLMIVADLVGATAYAGLAAMVLTGHAPLWALCLLAADWFGSLAFAPLGLLVAGPVAAHAGVGRALAGCAALIVLATAAALLAPRYAACAARPGRPAAARRRTVRERAVHLRRVPPAPPGPHRPALTAPPAPSVPP